jgi:hypothetical protein
VIILKYVTAWIFSIILQHYFDVGIIRISPPGFLRSSKKVNRLPKYPKLFPIAPPLNTFARRSRGRQKANAIYFDLAICLSSPRICDEKLTCLSAPNRAISMQAIRTNPCLSHHKIQPRENIDTRVENGRIASNAILVLSSYAMLSSCKAREQKPTGLLALDPFLTCERAWKAMETYYALS